MNVTVDKSYNSDEINNRLIQKVNIKLKVQHTVDKCTQILYNFHNIISPASDPRQRNIKYLIINKVSSIFAYYAYDKVIQNYDSQFLLTTHHTLAT